jgi:hypothetical protein
MLPWHINSPSSQYPPHISKLHTMGIYGQGIRVALIDYGVDFTKNETNPIQHGIGQCIGSDQFFYTSNGVTDATHCIGFFDTVHQYCIGKAMHYNLVALVCISFQYNADVILIHGYLLHHITLFHH